MIKLSVNVNKIATLRNSRGGSVPSVTEAVDVCLKAGAPGITVHPRADERHIKPGDVREIAAQIDEWRRQTGTHPEFNIEGDPRPDLLEMTIATKPDQCTLVPVTPGEITSHAGWASQSSSDALAAAIHRLQGAGIRVSLFVDPDEAPVRWARSVGADRIELYTEPFARAFKRGGDEARKSFDKYASVSRLAHELGLGVNAGHDLDLDNLTMFRNLPYLAEVSIGHALISHALWVGLDRAVRDYLAAVAAI
jgi:pyridoxine 5-phosphate synthase